MVLEVETQGGLVIVVYLRSFELGDVCAASIKRRDVAVR